MAILTRLVRQRFSHHTSNIILYEAHALVLSTLGISQGRSFLRDMEESNTALIRVREQDELHARAIVYRYNDKDFSLADATSFVLMQRLNIRYAFTFDHHFRQFGVARLTPELLQ